MEHEQGFETCRVRWCRAVSVGGGGESPAGVVARRHGWQAEGPQRRQALEFLFQKDLDQAAHRPGHRPTSEGAGDSDKVGVAWVGCEPWSRPGSVRSQQATQEGGRPGAPPAGALSSAAFPRPRSPVPSPHLPHRGLVSTPSLLPASLSTRDRFGEPQRALQRPPTYRARQEGPGARSQDAGSTPRAGFGVEGRRGTASGLASGTQTPAQSFPRN